MNGTTAAGNGGWRITRWSTWGPGGPDIHPSVHPAPTHRQLEYLAAMLRFGSRRAGARALGRSDATARGELAKLYRSLDVSGEQAAIQAAKVLGWLRIPADLAGYYAGEADP